MRDKASSNYGLIAVNISEAKHGVKSKVEKI